MKRSTKITSIIITFFLIISIVVIGRMMIGNHFAKKFSKRPPPGIIVTEVLKLIFLKKLKVLEQLYQKKMSHLELKEVT